MILVEYWIKKRLKLSFFHWLVRHCMQLVCLEVLSSHFGSNISNFEEFCLA